jgi:hypothetical protein
MAILRCHKLGSLLVAVAVASASLLIITAEAEAAKVGLFRMKRTWWGGTTTAAPAAPYISKNPQPRLVGPNAQPSPEVYVGSTTVSGRPAPRFTAPSKFIRDYTWHGWCRPGTCSDGYPMSSNWYSYWNQAGKWQPLNSRFGGASTPTTVVFPTTMGNVQPPIKTGNPTPNAVTTTPCNVTGVVGCGDWLVSITRMVESPGGTKTFTPHKIGDPIRFSDGNYDFERSGSIMVTPGKNRFGGTMHFFYGPNHTYYQQITINTAYMSRAWGPQMDNRPISADSVVGQHIYSGPFDIYRYTVLGSYPVTTGAGTPNSPGNLFVIRAPYFITLAPFTTGMITIDQPGPGFHTEFQLTGYDNRTSNGLAGVISMVRPRMVQTYKVFPDPSDPIEHTWGSGSAWQMDFHFLPEPGSSAMLASGLVVLAGLYRLRRR